MSPRPTTNDLYSADTPGERLAAGVVWFFGGVLTAAIALLIDTMIDGIAFAMTQHVLGREACVEGFNDTTIFATLGFAIFSSLFVGRWLFGLRRWVGTKVDDDHAEWGAMLRVRFATGAMLAFAFVTPVKWVVVLSWANCFGD